jgi:hypothetical protein
MTCLGLVSEIVISEFHDWESKQNDGRFHEIQKQIQNGANYGNGEWINGTIKVHQLQAKFVSFVALGDFDMVPYKSSRPTWGVASLRQPTDC